MERQNRREAEWAVKIAEKLNGPPKSPGSRMGRQNRREAEWSANIPGNFSRHFRHYLTHLEIPVVNIVC